VPGGVGVIRAHVGAWVLLEAAETGLNRGVFLVPDSRGHPDVGADRVADDIATD
jgi:hypothetical protein